MKKKFVSFLAIMSLMAGQNNLLAVDIQHDLVAVSINETNEEEQLQQEQGEEISAESNKLTEDASKLVQEKVTDGSVAEEAKDDLLQLELQEEMEDVTQEVVGEDVQQEEVDSDLVEEQVGVRHEQVILTLDVAEAIVNGEVYTLNAPPTVINSTTLLPLRFVGDQVVGALVQWDSKTQTVTITKDETEVVVKIGSKIATVDGMEVELLTEPVIQNNTTLLPLRFISEAFNIVTNYDSETKTITLDKEVATNGIDVPVEIPNEKPMASFYFPESYVAGQAVTAIETSSDPDGDQIVDRLWAVVGEKTVTNKNLSNMFKTPRAGTYTIGLQVQDEKGLWSDWTYETITISPNKAPVITGLTTSKASYAQGEALAFNYTYDNETWETVAEGKWTYRSIYEDSTRATVGKPGALFEAGDYIVTLYLDDAYGNRSEGVDVTVHITNEVEMDEITYRVTQGKIGDRIDNFANVNYQNFEPVTIKETSYDEGTLIMSDSPEDVKGPGILYRDKINGMGRVLIHHINKISGVTEKQRLALIVSNDTTEPVTLKLTNNVIKGPATDILRVGQICLYEYLQGTPEEIITLQPGEKRYLYDKNWQIDQCISGHVDVETIGDVTFTVAALNASDTLDTLENLIYYPADGAHYSGTYDKTGIRYTIDLDSSVPSKLLFGVINTGEWVTGYDARNMAYVENTGNFGVTYYVTVTATEDTAVILNNRGGTYKGAIKWQNEGVYNMPAEGTFLGTTTKAAYMGMIKAGETKTFEYLLPNGSAAPTLIGFIPKSHWSN